MAVFQDLPYEIILEIIKKFTTLKNSRFEALSALRATSKKLHEIVTPLVYSTLCIRSNPIDPTIHYRGEEALKALAGGSTKVYEYVTQLIFCLDMTVRRQGDVLSLEVEMAHQELVFNAISKLKNVKDVVWSIHGLNGQDYLIPGCIRALGTLPNLEAINFWLGSPSLTEHTLQPLSNLRKIWIMGVEHSLCPGEIGSVIARCPNLKELHLGVASFTFDDIFAEVSQLDNPLRLKQLMIYGPHITAEDFEKYVMHFRNLEYLSLRSTHSIHRDYSGVCLVLKKAKIWVKNLLYSRIDDPNTLDYFLSYPNPKSPSDSPLDNNQVGLESLCFFTGIYGEYTRLSSGLLDRIFLELLPLHCRTLRVLQLGREPLTDHQMAKIAACKELRKLSLNVCLTGSDLERCNTGLLLKWYRIANQLPHLHTLHIGRTYMHVRTPKTIEENMERLLAQAEVDYMLEYQEKLRFNVEK